jgi:RNA polymerase sigma-70 factor (ECF subfamily)
MASDDHELIRSAQSGDRHAFEQLLYRYDKHVFAIAARFGNSTDDAKDIYQEVFLRVHNGLKKFQQKSEFTTWLYRITTNVCLTYQSQRKKRFLNSIDEQREREDSTDNLMMNIVSQEAAPDQQTMSSEISFCVAEALGVLSPQQKLVFILRHYEGYKLREIASMMDCTEGTVKRYLFAATQRMRQQLSELLE